MNRFEKSEKEKQQIKEHFKKEKRKATLIFWSCDIAAVVVSYFLTNVIFREKFLQWFLVSLLFIVVFPITQFSKKLKQLRRAEEQQIKFSQQDM